MAMLGVLILAAALNVTQGDIALKIESEPAAVDPARSLFVTVSVTAPSEVTVEMPDLGARARGFSEADAFAEEPVTGPDRRTVRTVNWKLVPKPCAETYKLAPFVVRATRGEQDLSFVAGPLYFNPPAAREAVSGAFEVEPEKEVPPRSWRDWLRGLLWGVVVAALAFLAYLGVRLVMRKVKEVRMSPFERAVTELDRLLKRDLLPRGRYKDFYVELTLVVRRYVQRKYGVRAPHLTTEEFLRCLATDGALSASGCYGTMSEFLESADRIKFAGVKATDELAAEAVARARAYLKTDHAAKAAREVRS